MFFWKFLLDVPYIMLVVGSLTGLKIILDSTIDQIKITLYTYRLYISITVCQFKNKMKNCGRINGFHRINTFSNTPHRYACNFSCIRYFINIVFYFVQVRFMNLLKTIRVFISRMFWGVQDRQFNCLYLNSDGILLLLYRDIVVSMSEHCAFAITVLPSWSIRASTSHPKHGYIEQYYYSYLK